MYSYLLKGVGTLNNKTLKLHSSKTAKHIYHELKTKWKPINTAFFGARFQNPQPSLPKLPSITQFFLKCGHFLQFSILLLFFLLIWLHCTLSSVFPRIRISSYNLNNRGYILLNIWAKGGKKWPNICQSILYAVTSNVVTSEINRIFSWIKKQWRAD